MVAQLLIPLMQVSSPESSLALSAPHPHPLRPHASPHLPAWPLESLLWTAAVLFFFFLSVPIWVELAPCSQRDFVNNEMSATSLAFPCPQGDVAWPGHCPCRAASSPAWSPWVLCQAYHRSLCSTRQAQSASDPLTGFSIVWSLHLDSFPL